MADQVIEICVSEVYKFGPVTGSIRPLEGQITFVSGDKDTIWVKDYGDGTADIGSTGHLGGAHVAIAHLIDGVIIDEHVVDVNVISDPVNKLIVPINKVEA